MKLKHLPILYGIYLLLLAVLFGIVKITVKVMSVDILIACSAAFLIMSIIVIGITIMAINNHNQKQLEIKNQTALMTKKSPIDELSDYQTEFYSIGDGIALTRRKS